MSAQKAKRVSKAITMAVSVMLASALAPMLALADDGSQDVESGWTKVCQETSGFYYGWLVNAVVTVTDGVVSDVHVYAVNDDASEMPEYKLRYYEPAHYYMEESIVEAHVMADNPDAVDGVDIVSGATHTSTTIKKAVKAALAVWAQKKEAAFEADLANASVTLAKDAFVYTGSAIKPAASVASWSGKALTGGSDYSLSYENNVNAGTATVLVAGVEGGAYTGVKSATFTIAPAPQTIKAAKTYKVKLKKVKNAKQTVAVKFTANGGGKITYAKAKNGKISIAKNGKLTVAKGVKKGTYTLKVKVTAAAKGNYAKTTSNVTLKVKVT